MTNFLGGFVGNSNPLLGYIDGVRMPGTTGLEVLSNALLGSDLTRPSLPEGCFEILFHTTLVIAGVVLVLRLIASWLE